MSEERRQIMMLMSDLGGGYDRFTKEQLAEQDSNLIQYNYSTYPLNKMSLRLGERIGLEDIFVGRIQCYSAGFSEQSAPYTLINFRNGTFQQASLGFTTIGGLTDLIGSDNLTGFDIVNLSEGSTPIFYCDVYHTPYFSNGNDEKVTRIENDVIYPEQALAIFNLKQIVVPSDLFYYYTDFKVSYSMV